MEDGHTKKYRRISLVDKLKIIERIKNGEKQSIVANEYGVSNSAISHIMKIKDKVVEYTNLLEEYSGNKGKTRVCRQENSELEKLLYKWFEEQRALGNPVTGPLIQKTAMEINQQIGGIDNFKASSGWLQKFKMRHGIRERPTSANKYRRRKNAKHSVHCQPVEVDGEFGEIILQEFCPEGGEAAAIVQEEEEEEEEITVEASQKGTIQRSLVTREESGNYEIIPPFVPHKRQIDVGSSSGGAAASAVNVAELRQRAATDNKRKIELDEDEDDDDGHFELRLPKNKVTVVICANSSDARKITSSTLRERGSSKKELASNKKRGWLQLDNDDNGWRVLSDQDIMSNVAAQMEVENDPISVEEDCADEGVSPEEAHKCLSKFLQWYSSYSGCKSNLLGAFHILKDEIFQMIPTDHNLDVVHTYSKKQ